MLDSIVRRVRCNHALEHATINLLSRSFPSAQIMGFSGPFGFTLLSTLSTEEVVPAAMRALDRLKSGELGLRVHQNCGTNLVVTALLTTLATLMGMAGVSGKPLRRKLERLSPVVLLNVVALLVARPLGVWLQANVTTADDLSNTEIASIFTDYRGEWRRIRVNTRQS